MKNWQKNILLSISSLIIFILLAEGGTRLFWSPEKNNNQTHKGVVLAENNRGFYYEGVEYKTNSLGIRYKELISDTNKNKFKILPLGDSYIWGDGLQSDELVTLKLENILEKNTKGKFEVINAGIGGFNTEDEFNQLKRLSPYYKPDFVIQFFFTNDLIETNKEDKIDDWKINTITWLRANSRFYAFLYYLIKSRISSEVTVPRFLLPQDYFNLDESKPVWVSKRNTHWNGKTTTMASDTLAKFLIDEKLIDQ